VVHLFHEVKDVAVLLAAVTMIVLPFDVDSEGRGLFVMERAEAFELVPASRRESYIVVPDQVLNGNSIPDLFPYLIVQRRSHP
jgi:hypothetical protein